MNIIVTDAGGMINSLMVELLHSRGKSAIGICYKPTIDMTEISLEIKMIESNVRYPENIERIIWSIC